MSICGQISFAPALHAQTFEVAAIHASLDSGPFLAKAEPGGRLHIVNLPLKTLIRIAFRISEPQVVGPDWLATERFDISAIGDPDDTSLARMAPKLQALLADRFAMQSHTESQSRTVIALTRGTKLTPSQGGDGILNRGKTWLSGRNVSMTQLVAALSDAAGDLYVDETGFTGHLDIADFHFAPTETPDPTLPSIPTALRESLGIETKSRREPTTILVIDSIRRTPTPN